MTATPRLPRAERRETILRGAARAFGRAGYAGTSVADLAAEVGVSPLIVYRHFDSKEEIYRTILERTAERLADALVGAGVPGSARSPTRTVLDAARHDPEGFRLLWRHAAREPHFAGYADDLRARAVASTAAAMAGRVSDDTISWAAHAVVAYLVEAVLVWLEHGEPTRDAQFVAATDASLRAGIRVWSRPA